MSSAFEGLAGRYAETHPQAEDPKLRGRTYAIPFERVWSAAQEAAAGGSRRWTLVSADDRTGVLVAEVRTLLSRRTGDARIEISLDENGQTRLDLRVVMRGERRDMGAARRVVGSFVKQLDASLQVRPDQILDTTGVPSWSS